MYLTHFQHDKDLGESFNSLGSLSPIIENYHELSSEPNVFHIYFVVSSS